MTWCHGVFVFVTDVHLNDNRVTIEQGTHSRSCECPCIGGEVGRGDVTCATAVTHTTTSDPLQATNCHSLPGHPRWGVHAAAEADPPQ